MRRLADVTLPALAAFLLSLPLPAAECRRYELAVVVDGAALAEYPWRDRTYVEALRGRSFTLRLSNPTSERVAVAVSVDGRNVVDARRTSAREATKWVLDSGQSLEIPGWQISGETARRFFFTETARSYAKWLGDTANVGTIEAVFFRERRHRPQPLTAPQGQLDKDRGSERKTDAESGVARGPSSQNAPTVEAPSPKEATGDLRRDRAQIRPREDEGFAATGIGERTRFPVERVAFDEDPVPTARIALRYEFRRELVRLGVLSRADELSGREHARGFEPEYAPDPDRPRGQ